MNFQIQNADLELDWSSLAYLVVQIEIILSKKNSQAIQNKTLKYFGTILLNAFIEQKTKNIVSLNVFFVEKRGCKIVHMYDVVMVVIVSDISSIYIQL